MSSPDSSVVLKKFWAPWCSPCKAIAPVLDSTLSKFDRIRLESVNVDEDPDSAVLHSIRSVPTLLLMRDGQDAGRLCGCRTAEEIEAFLLEHL